VRTVIYFWSGSFFLSFLFSVPGLISEGGGNGEEEREKFEVLIYIRIVPCDFCHARLQVCQHVCKMSEGGERIFLDKSEGRSVEYGVQHLSVVT
jgi:hypothetical protein